MPIKRVLKDIIFFILNLFSGGSPAGAAVLMYHSIGENKLFFTVKEKCFEEQLRYLRNSGREIIKLSELLKRIKKGEDIRGNVVLTFDDGYRDNYSRVFPLLAGYGIPVTIFVATGFISGKFRTSEGNELEMLNNEEIREMKKSGLVEFMPHTESHCLLDRMDGERGYEEAEKSRRYLEEVTGEKADILSYPKGKRNKNLTKMLEDGNWLGAVTVEEGIIRKGDSLFELKRNAIDSSTSFTQFKGKISKAIEWYEMIKRRIRF